MDQGSEITFDGPATTFHTAYRTNEFGMLNGLLLQKWQSTDGTCRWRRVPEIDDSYPVDWSKE